MTKKAKAATEPPAHWTRETRAFDAACEAYRLVQREAAGRASPLARDAAKILGALVAALRVNDAEALREGTKWARKYTGEDGRAPQPELVRSLIGIVEARRCAHLDPKDHYEDCELDGIAADAAVKVAVSGLFDVGPTEGVVALTRRIRAALAKRQALQLQDSELQVKSILTAAGLTERTAGTWVNGGARPIRNTRR